MSLKKLRVGISGYGVVGKRRRQCVDDNHHLQVVAVCDRVFEHQGVMEDGVRYFTNYKEVPRARMHQHAA